MFLDHELIVDLSTNPEPGHSFFGFGTIEKRAVVSGLKAGNPYALEVRISTSDFIARSPVACWGGIRFGGVRQLDDEDALDRAATLAKRSDGTLARNLSRVSADRLQLLSLSLV